MSSNDSSEVRFTAYIAELVGVIGHADRAAPLRDYCTGLLMPAERKSVSRWPRYSTGPGRRPAPIAPAFCGPSAVVRCGRAHEGSRPGPARDRA